MSNKGNTEELPAGVSVRTEAGCIDVYENIFTPEISRKIIEIFEEANELEGCPCKFESAFVGHGTPGGDYRSNLTMNLGPHNNLYGEACSCRIHEVFIFLKEIFSSCVRHYCDKYEVEIAFDEGFQILKYSPGKEYKAHCDYGPGAAEHRVVSGLIYINPDEYEGGGTYFQNYNVNIKPSSPAVALFPSNYAYTHRAKAVLDGVKYAIVTWLGPPWMRPPNG
jgi:hypothetical protein